MSSVADSAPAAHPPALAQAISAYTGNDFIAAEALCNAIVAADPNCFEAFYLLAVMQSQRGLYDEALANYDKALLLRPRFAEAHDNRGLLLQEMRRHAEALASYETAVTLAPESASAWFNRGNTLRSLGRFEEALASYRRALALAPGDARAHHNRGVVLAMMERHTEALAAYDAALALAPDRAVTHCNRGGTLNALKRHDDALASFAAALALAPDYAEALNGRGYTLHEEGRLDDALVALDAALAIRPDLAAAHHNRAHTLTALSRFEAALVEYDHAQALKPDYAKAHHDEALCRLLIGDFRRGFEKYEWRWETEAFRHQRRNFDAPLWLGHEDIAGCTMLVHAEQGFGDTIMFCRYVPLLAARGARVVLEVQPALQRLLNRLTGAECVIAQGEASPAFDLRCPIMSLPLAFGTAADSIPPPCGLPALPRELVETWNERLGKQQWPRIGLAWSGNPAHGNDRKRSIPLATLAPLLDLPIDVVSLQREVREDDRAFLDRHGERITHFGDALTDFLETAALTSLMDAVVCVDTSIAHLAATLARPTFIMLPAAPDWRWLLNRAGSPWYPAVRLVRQSRRGEWDDVVVRVANEIRRLTENRRLKPATSATG